jgi:hypothetical protein
MLSEISDGAARTWWLGCGGKFHGPKIETATMTEADLLPLLKNLAAVCAAADALNKAVDIRILNSISDTDRGLLKQVINAKIDVQDSIASLTRK